MSIEIWKLILDAIKMIKEGTIEHIKLSRERKALILKEFIDPAYRALNDTYKDYQNVFAELKENIEQKKDPVETIALFRKQTIINKDTRTKLKDLDNQIREFKLLKRLGDENLKLAYAFAKAVDDFFDSTGKHQNISWFTAFVNELEFNLKKGINPFEVFSFQTIAGGENCWPSVKNTLKYASEEALPEAWLNVGRKYNALKGALLD